MALPLRQVVNIYFVYKINSWSNIQHVDFALWNSFFGAAKLTKNADPDKYKYSEYGIEFDAHEFIHCQMPVILVKMW